MRQTIETAPRDGNLVILGYDASGTYDVAHWLPEAGQWIGENGDPSKITPSRWYPMPGENYLQQGDGLSSGLSDASTSARRARRHGFFPFFSIAATLVAAALIGVYFHGEVVAYVARYASQQEISKLITIVPPVMAQQTPLPKDDEAAQLKQAVDSATAELRQSLQQEHDRAEALAMELAKARRDLETQVALSSKKGDEAAQFKQAAESATAELRQSLQRELDWVRDLDEAAQLKQAAESATAELRQSLQREHDRAEALVTELAQATRTMEQKPAGVKEKPAAKQSEGVAAKNSKPENKPVETAPLPKRVEHEPRGRALSPNCFYYRTYDPASGTYRSYDGRIRSCR